jgi:heme/copper-type cytochrome/quinol oxidase subunit 2
MSLPRLIGLDLLLIGLAVVGFLQAAAKDDTTTAEGVIFWLSVLALIVLVPALLILTIATIRRSANRSAKPS